MQRSTAISEELLMIYTALTNFLNGIICLVSISEFQVAVVILLASTVLGDFRLPVAFISNVPLKCWSIPGYYDH